MQFLSLIWENFKSYRGKHSLNFKDFDPGLYFLRGENLVDPEMGSNGAAKSTLLDIINWTLFGVSMRELPTTQLIPWGTKERPSATLKIRLNGKVMAIRRTYRPMTITIIRKGKERSVTQEQLQDLIGLTQATFENSIIIGQFTRLFFDLKPAEKMNIFTTLVDLDFWLERADHTNDTLKVIQDDADEEQKNIDTASTRIQEIRKSIKELKEEQAASKKDVKSDIRKLEKEEENLQSEYKSNQMTIDGYTEELKKINKREEKITKRRDNLEQKINTINNNLTMLKTHYKTQQDIISECKEQKRKLKKSSNKCLTCGQSVSKKHHSIEISKYTGKQENAEATIKGLDTDLTMLEEELSKSKETWENIKNDLKETITIKYNTQNTINDAEYENKDIKRQIKNCKRQLDVLKKAKKLKTGRIDKLKNRLAKIKKQRAEYREVLEELNKTIQELKLWVRGFKEIRLYELDEILTSLQVEINSYLTELGMEGWTVSLDVERETKRGKIKKGFQIMVDPGIGDNDKARPWEVWSGGEGQRLRLAGTLALTNLILRQFNQGSNIQFWDEQLTFISGSGKEDMLELLQEVAHREGKQIWIVDQNDLSFPWDGTLTVVKDKDGSRITH